MIWCEMWSLTFCMTFYLLVSMTWGVWTGFSPFATVTQIYKNRFNSTLKLPLPLSEASFDVKCGVKNFELPSVSQCLWCAVFGPNFLDLSQFPKYTKTGITRPSDGLYLRVRHLLRWNVKFNTLDDFLCISAHDLR